MTYAKAIVKMPNEFEWESVKKWGYTVARKYWHAVEMNAAVDMEDLQQAAGLAYVLASKTYTEGKSSFFTWYTYWVKACCRRTLGLDGRFRAEHYNTVSLDAPMGEDEDETLLDTIAAPETGLPLEIQMDIENALADLTEPQREVLHHRYWDEHSAEETAAEMSITPQEERSIHRKALRRLRHDRRLNGYVYRIHVGLEAFNTTQTSSTELAALINLERYRKM